MCSTEYFTQIWVYFYPFSERMDVKDRWRCDNTAETGLRTAEGQERHPVVGVRTDMNHPDKAI